MKRRKWSSEQKLKIVLEGLSGQQLKQIVGDLTIELKKSEYP